MLTTVPEVEAVVNGTELDWVICRSPFIECTLQATFRGAALARGKTVWSFKALKHLFISLNFTEIHRMSIIHFNCLFVSLNKSKSYVSSFQELGSKTRGSFSADIDTLL